MLRHSAMLAVLSCFIHFIGSLGSFGSFFFACLLSANHLICVINGLSISTPIMSGNWLPFLLVINKFPIIWAIISFAVCSGMSLGFTTFKCLSHKSWSHPPNTGGCSGNLGYFTPGAIPILAPINISSGLNPNLSGHARDNRVKVKSWKSLYFIFFLYSSAPVNENLVKMVPASSVCFTSSYSSFPSLSTRKYAFPLYNRLTLPRCCPKLAIGFFWVAGGSYFHPPPNFVVSSQLVKIIFLISSVTPASYIQVIKNTVPAGSPMVIPSAAGAIPASNSTQQTPALFNISFCLSVNLLFINIPVLSSGAICSGLNPSTFRSLPLYGVVILHGTPLNVALISNTLYPNPLVSSFNA